MTEQLDCGPRRDDNCLDPQRAVGASPPGGDAAPRDPAPTRRTPRSAWSWPRSRRRGRHERAGDRDGRAARRPSGRTRRAASACRRLQSARDLLAAENATVRRELDRATTSAREVDEQLRAPPPNGRHGCGPGRSDGHEAPKDLGGVVGEEAPVIANSARISAFVITYNSGPILDTCPRSLRFVDELIVVDVVYRHHPRRRDALGGQAHQRSMVAAADRDPPSCPRRVSHDFILYLDHDECRTSTASGGQAHALMGQAFSSRSVSTADGLHAPRRLAGRCSRAPSAAAPPEFVRTLHRVGLRVPEAAMFDIPTTPCPYPQPVAQEHAPVDREDEPLHRRADRVSYVDTASALPPSARNASSTGCRSPGHVRTASSAAALLRRVRHRRPREAVGGEPRPSTAMRCSPPSCRVDAAYDESTRRRSMAAPPTFRPAGARAHDRRHRPRHCAVLSDPGRRADACVRAVRH